MNELMVFNNKEFGKIRTIEIDEKIYFVGKDIANILGYSNTKKAITDHVDDDDKGVTKCDTLGGKQSLIIINESGLYSLILSSKMPKAKQFKHWITAEVLPSIRKHGMYATKDLLDNPDLAIEAFKRLKEEKDNNKLLAEKLESQKDKVLFAESVETANDSVLIGDLAKLLKQNGTDIGQNRLFEWLRENGYLIKNGDSRNIPTQKAMDKKLFEIKERTIISPNGHTKIIRTTKVTGKGQIYFINIFCGNEVDHDAK